MPKTPVSQLVLCVLLLSQIVAEAIGQMTPLNSAVLIYDKKTLIAAPEVVDRIANLGDDRIMFVVTVHCRLTPEFRPTELGLMADRYRPWRDPRNFESLTSEVLAFYQEHLQLALRRATHHGMHISLLLHFDPAGEVLEWRNHHDFDPLEKFSGYSYETSLVDLCIESVLRATGSDASIDFSLAGEMGRSVFAYPASYEALRQKVRRSLGEREIVIGISLNHNDLAGGHKLTAEQRTGVQRLFSALDFVGFSSYAPFDPPVTAEKFRKDCEHFMGALEAEGISLGQDTPLHFSEIGLGGAPTRRGDVSVERAAAEPWEGTVRPWNNPWKTEPMISLRRTYHGALLEFLKTQPGPRHVEAAYFWSEGSWEPMGVYRAAFVDEEIRSAITQHNAAARAESE